MRQRLARRMMGELAPAAWVVDDTAFPKFGRWSVGVAPLPRRGTTTSTNLTEHC